MKITIFVIVVLFLTMFCFSCDKSKDTITNYSDWIVNFPDTNLALVIRDILEKPTGSINREELLTIKSLTAMSKGIKYLDGLGYLDSLNYLDLSYNEIMDIEDLAGLSNLNTLSLGYNKLIKVDSLAGLRNLRTLRLNNNGITIVSFLEYLPNLEEAYLSANYIHNIAPIVRNLNYGGGDSFDLRGNPLEDISRNQYIPELRNRGVIITY